ncbi:hypothetical protein [Streptosporangium sp. NPDC051022]|uniref:hypothetical protein n=1 Tax=Streptosporangium sp. NPDC051022 TaxID=3155752 RepID=UPI0034298E9D
MSAKDELHRLVEEIQDNEAEELLREVRQRYCVPARRRRSPAFVGMGDSGRSDLSEHVDDALREGGFGR